MGIRLAGRIARHVCLIVLLVFVLCGAIVLAVPLVQAWYHYRAAQASLACYHFAESRDHLAIALRSWWPFSWRLHLLAARAARLDNAFTEARQHLQYCLQSHAEDSEVFMEWALFRAQTGELGAVEAFLKDLLRQGADGTPPWIQEALIEGCIRTYRLGTAEAGIDDWLERQPDDTQALYLQGCLWQQVQRPQKALTSYRRILELDPQRDDARLRLSQCLIQLSLNEEANAHLEYLHLRYPENAEITIELASTRFKQGRLAEARQLLDAVLAEHPDNEAAMRERGRLALAEGNATEAENWLRQAEKLNPYDAQLLPLLSVALEHQGKREEVQVLQDRIQQNDRDFHRLAQICLHELAERPDDPALHSELGALLLRLGYLEAGRNWLFLALQEEPNCTSARTALENLSQAERQP